MKMNTFCWARQWLSRMWVGGGIGALAFLAPQVALATTYTTYELEGTIMTPIYDTTYGRNTFTGYYYAQFINKGDLTMVVDNTNGRMSITGRTYGCVVASGANCSSNPKDKFGPDQVGAYNVNYGWGYFDWNLYMTGGRGPYGSDSDNPIVVFENMDPDIGYVQIVDAHPGIKEYITVGAKKSNETGYSLAVLDGNVKNDGFVYIAGWLEHQYGVIGGQARAESPYNSAAANTWLVGYEVKPDVPPHKPPKPPPTEVPEPASMLLLGSGVAGIIAKKRKLKSPAA